MSQDSGEGRPSAGDAGEETARCSVMIGNQLGLHARAAAKFVKTAERFDAEIWVVRNGTRVSGVSILGLMMLAAGPGAEISLEARGAEASGAVEALRQLVSGNFDDDEG